MPGILRHMGNEGVVVGKAEAAQVLVVLIGSEPLLKVLLTMLRPHSIVHNTQAQETVQHRTVFLKPGFVSCTDLGESI
jgi:hypothetical protein